MLIEKLEAKNFRALREVTLNCSRLTAILGRNGAGKSSLLTAIDLFYNTAGTVTTEDFYDRDTNSPVEIRVTYSGLTNEEMQEFSGYLLNDKLSVLKRFDGTGNGRYYASAMPVPVGERQGPYWALASNGKESERRPDSAVRRALPNDIYGNEPFRPGTI